MGYFLHAMLLRAVFIRLAAFTGAKTRSQRLTSIGKETDIFAQCMFCTTGRTAKNAGSLNGENKLTVGIDIAIHDGLPAVIISYL